VCDGDELQVMNGEPVVKRKLNGPKREHRTNKSKFLASSLARLVCDERRKCSLAIGCTSKAR